MVAKLSSNDILAKAVKVLEVLRKRPLSRLELTEITGLSLRVASNLIHALERELQVEIRFNREIEAYELVNEGELARTKFRLQRQ